MINFLRLFSSRILLITFLLGSFLTAQAQQQTPFSCATDEATAQRLATDSTYRRFYQNLKPNQDKGGVDTTTIYTIPVVFVVYHLGEPVGTGSNISDAALQAQIDLMNRMFAGQRPDYDGADTKIRFALARRTPSCTPFNGIARVDARSVPGYQSGGLGWTDNNMANQLRALLPEYANSVSERFIVVRVAHQVYGAGGWASYGGDITVPAGSMSYADRYSSLLTHEMGHALFLRHTFEGSYNDGVSQCSPNANPEFDGDAVADTDPHRSNEPTNSCSTASENVINSCTGRPFGLIGRNYMSYGCNLKLFTTGQMVRMRSYFTENMRGLINSPYLNPPLPNEPSVAAACQPTTVSAISPHYDGVHRVQFQQIDKFFFSDTYNLGRNYYDYSCSERTTVTAGQSYSLIIGGQGKFRRVYIDYNNDGSFDENTERVLTDQLAVSNYGQTVSSQLVSIPTNAVTDRYLRMRVIIDGGSVAPTACNLPGGQYGSGEAEDYGIRILPADTPVSVAIGELTSAYTCRGAQLSVPVIIQGMFEAGNVFNIQLSDATGSFANPTAVGSGTISPIAVQLPLSLPLGNDYRMRVVASNPALTSLPGLTLTLEDLPTATISGSQTVVSGQVASLTVALTGRRPLSFTIKRGQESWYSYADTYASPASFTFIPESSAVYTLDYVRNVCGNGTVSGSAIVTVLCAEPKSLSESQYGHTNMIFYWDAVAGTRYDLQFKETSATDWTSRNNIPVSNWQLSGFEIGKAYQWRIRKLCTNGVSAWSDIRTFTMQCIPPVDRQESISFSSAVLIWAPSGTNPIYGLRWREAGSTTWNDVPAQQLTNANYTLGGLTPGNVYEWQVRVNCANGEVSDYSALRWFSSTQCTAPQPTGFANLAGQSVQVSWSNVRPGLRYQIRWRAAGTTNWTQRDSLTTGNGAIIRGLSAYTNYEWQVRTFCTPEQASDYSATGYFNTNCQPPVSLNTNNVMPTSAQLYWYVASGTQAEVRWRPVGSNTWNTVSAPVTSSYSLTGLTTGTTYEWQVQSVCSGGATSGFTTSLTFTARCPTPTYMNEYIVMGSLAAVQWTVGQLNIVSAVEWRPVGSTTWQTSTTLTPSSGSNFSYTLTGLTSGQTYEWRVVTTCPGGSTTPSLSRIFIAQCSAPTPYGSYMDGRDMIVSYQQKLTSAYQIRWRLASSNSWTESTTTASTSYRISGLITSELYEWQVRLLCADGGISDYSTSTTMVLSCFSPYGTFVSNIRPSSARLSWQHNGNTYEIRYRQTTNPTWTTISGLASTTYALTGLTNGAVYEWQVRSVCSETVLSAYSSSLFFTTTCRVPTYFYESYVLASSALVNWSSESDMQYVVEWRPQGAATWQQSGTPSSGSSYTLTGLTNGLTYEWRVSTDCEGTLTPSASRTLLTQCVQLRANAMFLYNVTSGQAGLSWSGLWNLPGLAYRVHWRPVGTTAWIESETLTRGTYLATGLTNNTTYEWQVQSICDGVETPYVTATSNFTTNCAASTASGIFIPGDTSVQLNWTITPGERYNVEYRITTDPIWTSINSLTTNTYRLTTTPGTAYEYRIRTACSDGSTGTVSNVVAFTTLPACDPNEPNNSFTAATPIPGTSFTSAALCINRPGDQDWFRWQHNGYEYYVLMDGASNLLGPYQLSLDLAGNTLTIKTTAVNGSYPYAQLRLVAADGITNITTGTYSGGSPTPQIVYTLPPVCTVMTTVKNGNWTDPTVWSCNRIPISTDTVQVQHTVMVPYGTTGQAKGVTYGAGGKLTMNTGARLMLGL